MIDMVKTPPLVCQCACGTEVEYDIEKAGAAVSQIISGKATSIGIMEGEHCSGILECPNCKATIATPAKVTRYRQIGPTMGLWIEIEM